MGGVVGEERVDFADVVLVGQLHGQVPLVQRDADVDRLLDLRTHAHVSPHSKRGKRLPAR